MASRATITFSQPGVQPPVYVVTSLSSPAWETLEMNVEGKETEGDDLLFTRHFDDVAEGSYQYKIRIGEGHWVVDESKESATDDPGNRNNVVHVKHVAEPDPVDFKDVSTGEKRQDSVQLEDERTEPESNAGPSAQPEPAQTSSPAEDPQKDEPASSQLPSVPVPFTVVEKVSDQPHEGYGDLEAASLHEDSKKRVADAEPDFETVQPPSPVATKDTEPASPPIPTVVIEKTDDKPSFGDDFGDDATSGQKFAHEQRLADATPDEVVVSPEITHADSPSVESTPDNPPESDEAHGEPGPLDEETAPLFRHESIVIDPPQEPAEEPKPSSMDTIEEESAHSSTDQTGSQIMTPDEEEGDDEELDELENGPLLSHETGFSKDEDSLDELENVPLLSHETGFSGYEEGEHFEEDVGVDQENGPEDEGYDEIVREVDDVKNEVDGPERATTQHGTVDEDDEDSQAPLLPHEQDSAIEDGPVLDGEPTFSYEAATPIPLPEQGLDSFFATRTRTGSLPHTIPRFEEDDEDLNDPSLEAFPTDRESILACVATISSSIPEDQTKELEHVESPGCSVLSNACSSVSLAPRSGSLESVVEEDIEPGSGSELHSPVLLTSTSGPAATETVANGADVPSPVEHAKRTMPEAPSNVQSADPTQPAVQSDESSAARSTETSDADSVQKKDGANDGSKKRENIYDSVATPSNVLRPPTPPLTPKKKDKTSAKEVSADATPQETEEPTPASDSTEDTPHPKEQPQRAPAKTDKDKGNSSSSPATQQYPPNEQKDSWIKGFARVVFGPVGRLLASCFGGPKQAR
ncbi:hypothetical protein BDV96DRAFT_497355 [Lophiotrema nucula]|uniref:AMP-activated protein kinase glycogen-binding domain-containing protein n=1 Tax=Lophiotrema nucula TaxID=690887 RepID=A0A6A5Z2R3_9PLEO|nr:hypothetical protein BDV96DRAFT_497355 [Lophiotrema nucula]